MTRLCKERQRREDGREGRRRWLAGRRRGGERRIRRKEPGGRVEIAASRRGPVGVHSQQREDTNASGVLASLGATQDETKAESKLPIDATLGPQHMHGLRGHFFFPFSPGGRYGGRRNACGYAMAYSKSRPVHPSLSAPSPRAYRSTPPWRERVLRICAAISGLTERVRPATGCGRRQEREALSPFFADGGCSSFPFFVSTGPMAAWRNGGRRRLRAGVSRWRFAPGACEVRPQSNWCDAFLLFS
jgi:hypothetical protein